jgi:tripartite ATP-independent transporter DctP family solute receptor
MKLKAFLFVLMLVFQVQLFADNNKQVVIAHMFPQNSLPDVAAKALSKNLMQDNNFKDIIIAPAAKLGDERENLRQLQRGEIELAVVGDLVLEYLTPQFRLISLPFTHKSVDEALAIYNSELGDEIKQSLFEQGITVLSWHAIGQRMLTANRPINSKKDLEGLQLRLPPAPVSMSVWKALGVSTRAVPFPELYDALKSKRVEAQENPPNFIRAKKFYEVQDYLILTKHIVQRQFILASNQYVQSLNKKELETLKKSAIKASQKNN